ncbi:hypothetical protein C7121_29295 [Paenibacillus glucanolyticus]|uniref:hypothetical protein n=1 Tax=Paenibacillus glucanolyticus TaxID=59843 RepID=UPI000D21A7C1|nr:hypothetical protein [Paenibacillus glucanolyticus]AVV59929.1 hypothetical protein C7121_29295 [Paenibacillus glucanolyticus]
MKRRRAARATLNTTEKREGGSGESYRAGYQAGYALGLRLGQEDRGSVFDGTSIIIPAHPHHDSAVQVIQHVETMTPTCMKCLLQMLGPHRPRDGIFLDGAEPYGILRGRAATILLLS